MYSSEFDRSDYEYHCNYRQNPGDPTPTLELSVPEKPKRHKNGRRIIAAVLCAVLLSASFGAGWTARKSEMQHKGETQMQMVNRNLTEVETVSVTGSQKLSFPEIYTANVDSCISINVSSVGYNFFGQPVQSASSGSGFIITRDGYAVTNYHVINGGENITVTLNDGKSYSAQLVGGDKDYDIAVLKIDSGDTELKPVTLGTSSSLQVGDDVSTIGNPLGQLTFSMAEGIVSCLNREINLDGTPFNMIQISAAVNSGNSGGPLFNSYGEVVGIVSAKYSSGSFSSTASIEGLGFAIPMDDILTMIQDIMTNGEVTSHAYMGVTVADASNYPDSGVRSGGYLIDIVQDGPADRAGLQAGDVVTMIGTDMVMDSSDLTSVLGGKRYKAGDTAAVAYVRDGQVYTTEITFGSTTEKPAEADESQQISQSKAQQDRRHQDPDGAYLYPDMESFFNEFFDGYDFGG